MRRDTEDDLAGRWAAAVLGAQPQQDPPAPKSERRRLLPVANVEDYERPRTRGDCLAMPRPCPFVGCAHHLYLSVAPKTGEIRLHQPDLEVWEMEQTCALDVAEGHARGSGKGDGETLEVVGEILGVTRERIRQIEARALVKYQRAARRFGSGLAEIARIDGYGQEHRVRHGGDHGPDQDAEHDEDEDVDEDG